jgi:hypothetical protein
MARRPSLALLIIVAGSAFLIGLYTAFLQGDPAEPPAVAATQIQTALPEAPAESERILLLLGVDDLNSPEAALEAIWLLSFRPPAKDLFLLGIPTDLTTAGDPPLSLAQQFTFQQEAGLSAGFLDALYREIPLEVDAVIVLDDTGFAQAIDYLGGVTINEATFTGQEVLGIISLSEGDPAASLALQRRLLQAMSVQAAQVGATPEITALVELVPDHLYLSESINTMVELLSPALPILPDTTHFELY